jgi:hypothetical protein
MAMVTRKKAKKTAFVPRSLFAGAVGIGVIPICVSACGGLTQAPQSSGGTVASGGFGVASGAFSGGVAYSGAFSGGVASGAFSGGVATGAFSGTVASSGFEFIVAASGFSGAVGVAAAGFDATVGLSVAAMGFDGGPPPSLDAADAGFASPEPSVEAGGAHDAARDAPELTVAFMGFDASTQGRDAGDKG